MALIALILPVVFGVEPGSAQNLTLASFPSGLTIAGAAPSYMASFGTMNGMGVGTPGGGVTVIPVSNGALYYTLFNLTAGGLPGPHMGQVTATVSSNFGQPAAFTAESCSAPAGCTSSGSYSALTTTSNNVIATLGNNQTVTAGLAIFVPDDDGASAYSGLDTAQITFTITDISNGHSGSVTLTVTVQNQTAVQLTLGTAPGGATIAAASDFSLNFGNVNGLGIGPGPGLSSTSVAGGMMYETPYLILPAFSGLSSTTATISVYVSTNFAHPALLTLNDATSAGGPYGVISTTAGTPTQITASAADRTSITRYLGLFVSNVNGASAFNGMDSATLTFTMTVP